MRLSTRIPTTSQLRAHEAAWIEACNPNWGMVLMELAGSHASEVALSMLDKQAVSIICGPGNNGGDGLVVARYLSMSGIPVSTYIIKSDKNRAESQVNSKILKHLGIKIHVIDNLEVLSQSLAQSGLIIDALLGTGLDRPVDGIYQDVIQAINESHVPVLSIDIPSGINSDTGQVMGIAVNAQATVTFGYLKAGLLCHPGADHAGDVVLVDIGLPTMNKASDGHPRWWLTTADRVQEILPTRPVDSHKGDFGCLLTIAGSPGMSGASLLASKSALRAGAGLSILATPHSLVTQLPPEEVIYHGVSESSVQTISVQAIADLDFSKASALVLGPGLSLNPDTVKFVHKLIGSITLPCLIDADGLNALSQDPSCLPKDSKHFVLTPHPKELSRLLGKSVAEIQADRMGAVQQAAAKFGCVVVLKGAHTVTANAAGEVFVNPTGNAGMATAGAGDVLSGIIGGLLAQKLDPFNAAIAGVYIHGAAGDLAAQQIGEVGITAGDIMSFVPAAISELHSGEYSGSNFERKLAGLLG